MTAKRPRYPSGADPYRPARLPTVLRGVAALLLHAAGLVAIPIALLVVAGNPLPHSLPTSHQIWSMLMSPASDDTLILATVRDLAWVLWVAFTCPP